MFYGGSSGAVFRRADEVVDRIYQRAKKSDHTLSEAEILECVPAASSQKK